MDVGKLDVVVVEFEFLVVVALTVCCVCEDVLDEVEVLVADEVLMVDGLVSVSGVVIDVSDVVDCPLVVTVEEAPIEVDVGKLDVVEIEFVVVMTVWMV